MELTFYKYQATGNDFVMLDDRDGQLAERLSPKAVARLCHRRFGIGADGLILLQSHPEYHFKMQYYNSDGGLSTMCGNGGRSLVAFARDLGIEADIYSFEAIDGLHHARIKEGLVELQMTAPKGFKSLADGQYWLDTGSPHYVGFFDTDVAELEVVAEGKRIRNSEAFAPGGTNVNFVNILNESELSVRTYERGVEDETYSCGTGVTACALVHLYNSKRKSGEIKLHTPGGKLRVKLDEEGDVFLTGPAERVFSGKITLSAISD
ncbi:MAG: diaminopimelate epimerase [Bacteroidota bacterium]